MITIEEEVGEAGGGPAVDVDWRDPVRSVTLVQFCATHTQRTTSSFVDNRLSTIYILQMEITLWRCGLLREF